jgi:hypothetical protein
MMNLVATIVVYTRNYQVPLTIMVVGMVKSEGYAAFLRQDTFQYLSSKKVRNGFTGVFFAEVFCPAGGNVRVDRAALFAGDN